MTGPSPQASAPWPSPRPSGISACKSRRTILLGQAYYARATIVGPWTPSGGTWRPSKATWCYEHFGLAVLPAVFSRTWLAGCHAELGAFAEGIARGEEGVRIAESAAQPYSRMSPFHRASVPPQRGPRKALAVLERGLGLCQDWNLGLVPQHCLALGLCICPVRACRRGRSSAGAGCGTDDSHNRVGVRPLDVSLGEAYLLAGQREEAIQLAERALTLAGEHRTRPPGVGPAPPR